MGNGSCVCSGVLPIWYSGGSTRIVRGTIKLPAFGGRSRAVAVDSLVSSLYNDAEHDELIHRFAHKHAAGRLCRIVYHVFALTVKYSSLDGAHPGFLVMDGDANS